MMGLANKMQQRCTIRPVGAVAPPLSSKPALRRALPVMRAQEQTKDESSTNSKLTQEQLDEVGMTNVGDISPQKAELRADMGSNWNDVGQMQAFDGPAPETINGRTAMLGVLIAVLYELRTGLDLEQQVQDHPYAVIASFVIIAIATYVPLFKGVTRKESYENGPWTAQAENWNGRIAMLGFLGMVLFEASIGTSTVFALGL